MSARRTVVAAVVSALVAAALFAWTVYEAREQQNVVREALSAQVTLLAESLAPGLSAASAASYELDEILLWKLLDNARLLGEVYVLDPEALDHFEPILEANGLDTVVLFDVAGGIIAEFGEPAGTELLKLTREFLSKSGDELVLGSSILHDVEHLAAVARIQGSGAVLVRVEGPTARTFGERLGVENLLERLVGVGGVLYLGYFEEPGGLQSEASWNDAPLPPDIASVPGLRQVAGRSIFEARVRLVAPAGRDAWLRAGLDGAPLEAAARAAMLKTLVMGSVLAVLALLGGGFAVITRLRVSEKEKAAERVARLEAARHRSERLAAAGVLAAGLAHEVRNPLNAIGLAGQTLERKLSGEEERGLASRIKKEVGRLEEVLQSFLRLAKPGTEQRRETDLKGLCLEVIDLLQVEADQKGVELKGPDGTDTIQVEREALRRALVNLVRNAIEASPENGLVLLTIRREGTMVSISVIDEGSGVEEEMRERAFEPFVSGHSSGTGLGLALVRRIVQEHGGEAQLKNRQPHGAEAVIRLPSQTGGHT